MGPRVLFVDHSAQPGGGQLGLLRYLEKESPVSAAVLFLNGGPVGDQIESLGIDVWTLNQDPDFSLKSIPRRLPTIRRTLEKINPDIIVANSLYAAAAVAWAFGRRRPYLIYYSRVSMDSLRGFKRFIALKWIFSRFDEFIANSRWTASCIPKPLNDRPVSVAYPVSGVSGVMQTREIAPCSGETIRIVSLSRPDPWKGTDLIVDAASQLARQFPDKKITLDIYGGIFFSDHKYLQELRNLAASSPVEVVFKGHVADVGPVLLKADVMVLSTRIPEPFGQVVPQGLAAGAVVVVPAGGGPLEVITDGVNGLVFQTGDARSLAERISLVIRDPGLAAELSTQGMDRSADFADEVVAGMLTSALQRASLNTMRRFHAQTSK